MITQRRVRPITPDQLLDRVRREFAALPGLRLTAGQARRLWGLESRDCEALFRALVDCRFLTRMADGSYVRADLRRLLASAVAAPTGHTQPRRTA
jgi:hypothetical protein